METTYKLEKIVCASCGIPFWIDTDFDSRLRDDKRSFYCPKGHSQSYTGESLKHKIIKLEKNKEEERILKDNLYKEIDGLGRSIIGYKGVIGRMKNRGK